MENRIIGGLAKIVSTRRRRLVAAAVAYALVFVGYGHAGLPLGLVLPAVWANWDTADRAVAAVAGAGAIGVAITLASALFDDDSLALRISAPLAIAAFTISIALSIAISAIPIVTVLSTMPFGAFAGSNVILIRRQHR